VKLKWLAHTIPIDECRSGSLPAVEYEDQYYNDLEKEVFLGNFTGVKKKVVSRLIDGFSFSEIKKMDNVKNIYEVRKSIIEDMSWVFDKEEFDKYLDKDDHEKKADEFLKEIVTISKNITFKRFIKSFILDYDEEANFKNWQVPQIQQHYFDVWDKHPKSRIVAPREHLKTTTVCQYLVRRIFERDYPLEIIYLHLSKDIAIEKVRLIQSIIERNPVFSQTIKIDEAKNWKDGALRLMDGTTLTASSFGSGIVGKHPDIIVLDDVIDQQVIYSDVKNDKAIRKFYSDVYPMITKAGEDKKIIVIGTIQREDDLYNRLPDDFHCETLDAIVSEEKKQVLAPELFSWDDLMKVKADMSSQFGERYWLKEYRNIPLEAMGEIIKPEWIKTYTVAPDYGDVFQAWDLSVGKDVGSGDSTAGATIRVIKEGETLKIYVLDIFKARIEFAERLKAIVSLGNRYNPLAIGVEENVFQYDTVNTLKKQTNLPIVGIKTIKNKIEKFRVELAPHFENGKVFIASDMLELKQELLALPYGQFDDTCDSLTLAIQLSAQFGGEPIIDFL